MVPEPTTFKQLVEADLRRAARLIIKVQDELDPQFRIATPEGDYHLSVTLPSDGDAREAMLRRVATLMAWKLAPSFTLACELAEPDCVSCTGISHHEVHASPGGLEGLKKRVVEKVLHTPTDGAIQGGQGGRLL